MKPLDGGGYYAGYALPYGIGTEATGTLTVGDSVILPTSLNANVDGEVKEYKGPTGQVITLIVPRQFVTISGDGWIVGSTAALSAVQKGASVTISGDALSKLGLSQSALGKLRLETLSAQFSNEDVAKVSFTIKEYPEIAAD